jgi:NOL1/NOP2/fmu family ribosome biogenesis protein
MPEGVPDVKGIRFLRTGLYLGDLKKNRFEPSQSLAMCLKKEEYKKCLNLTAEDVRVVKYLKGETIEVDDIVTQKDKGWFLVLVDGYPLGWGKLAGGTLKNKYLPGWRWQS